MAMLATLIFTFASTAAGQCIAGTEPANACVAGSTDEATAKRWVKVHNQFRCSNGMGNVAWSKEAADNAQEYVNTLTGLVHSAAYQLTWPAGPAGENLAMGYQSLEAAVAGWHSEEKDCIWQEDGEDAGCSKAAGDAMVGHFTAMTWKGVTQIGCAIRADYKIYICRYLSGSILGPQTANMAGAFPISVFPPKAECADTPDNQICQACTNEPDTLFPEINFDGSAAYGDLLTKKEVQDVKNFGPESQKNPIQLRIFALVILLAILGICCLLCVRANQWKNVEDASPVTKPKFGSMRAMNQPERPSFNPNF